MPQREEIHSPHRQKSEKVIAVQRSKAVVCRRIIRKAGYSFGFDFPHQMQRMIALEQTQPRAATLRF